MRKLRALAPFCALLAGLWSGALGAASGAPRLPIESLRGAHWGMQVVDLADGRVVFEHAPDVLMVPASTMKLMTAAVVLLEAPSAAISTGAVLDDRRRLWVLGSADPSWATSDVESLARVAASARVTEVVLDERQVAGARLGPGWAWDDETDAYSAPLGAFGVNENTVRVRLSPALAAAAPLRPETEPDGVLVVENGAVTGGADADDTVIMRREEGTDRLRLAGVLPAGTCIDELVAVHDGTAYTATLLRQALVRLGVSATVRRAEAAEGVPVGRSVWARVSPPVSRLLVRMLKESDNYYAEQLMRWLGTRPPVSDGLDRAEAVLERLGVKRGAYRQVDGSGLSRMNLVSSAQLVTVLKGMAANRSLVEALPVAGVDGTLARRFKASPLRGVLRAKTGSMSGVSALAGYLCDAAGQPRYAFAFIVNGAVAPTREVKDLEEQTVEAVLAPLLQR